MDSEAQGAHSGYIATAALFGVVPVYPAAPSINQKSLFFLCQLIVGNSHEAIGTDWENKVVKQDWGPWAFGPLLYVTYLCLQGLLGPKSCICHFHLMTDAAVHAQLYGLVGQITEFMMGSSGHMVTWWPMVKRSVSIKAQ